jgi:predicted HicB family RNase H-like nuclease
LEAFTQRNLDPKKNTPQVEAKFTMRTIDDGDVLREYNIFDLVEEFQADALWLDKSDIDEWEEDLIKSQYAYVKFGLILQQIRNGCWWNRCQEKFSDFRSFCERKINLNKWQVANAIKSAQVAVKLMNLGFEQFPRNASQALKLSDLSIERLGEVWGNILEKYQSHKITALAIEAQINPDKQITSETVRLPARVADALRQQATAAGMTLNEYLEELAFLEPLDDDRPIDQTESAIELNPEMLALLDRVEYQWLKPVEPKKIIETAVDGFDRLLDNLIGQFIPPVQRVEP